MLLGNSKFKFPQWLSAVLSLLLVRSKMTRSVCHILFSQRKSSDSGVRWSRLLCQVTLKQKPSLCGGVQSVKALRKSHWMWLMKDEWSMLIVTCVLEPTCLFVVCTLSPNTSDSIIVTTSCTELLFTADVWEQCARLHHQTFCVWSCFMGHQHHTSLCAPSDRLDHHYSQTRTFLTKLCIDSYTIKPQREQSVDSCCNNLLFLDLLKTWDTLNPKLLPAFLSLGICRTWCSWIPAWQ